MSNKIKYSQFKASLAIFKASLISVTRNPSSLFFSMIFPIIFIAIFGLLGDTPAKMKVYLTPGCDKNNVVFETVDSFGTLIYKDYATEDLARNDLEIGKLDAIIDIQGNNGSYVVNLTTSDASYQNGNILKSLIEGISDKANLAFAHLENPLIQFNQEKIGGREYKMIDFILPGQLGFALLNSGIYGTAFVLLMFREQLILKRFFATPIKRLNILVAEGASRLVFSTVQAVFLILVGYLFFHFTLVNGYTTLLEMVGLSILGLVVFLGLGLLISGIAKDENTIAPIANIFTLPQLMLSGSFFAIDAFPKWLQTVSKFLPLTHFNEAMRKIAFEGANFQDIGVNLLVLGIWAIIIYAISAKLFKWEK